jgi:hypothetical protein
VKLLDKLERKLRPFAIPNLTPILIVAQIIGFLLVSAKPAQVEQMSLVMDRVYAGEFWRIGTFLFIPPATNPIFLFFSLYLFYLMGTALESRWGEFRYTLYVLIAYVATLAAAALAPMAPASSGYIGLSVYLAFAYLYPNFELMLFFILPVKIKYLALFAWISMFIGFAMGDWVTRVLIVSSVANFLLFFGKEIVWRVSDGKRRMEWQARQLKQRDKPFHNCAICGATERSHPRMDFRYCSKCAGSYEYCAEHLQTHEHVALGEAGPTPVEPA